MSTIKAAARVTVQGLACAMLMAACVTVNVYFPAAQVERAADRIVDDVYKNSEPAASGQENSSLVQQMLAMLGPSQAWAQDAASVSNAAIRGIKSKIAANHGMLAPYYNAGNIGIAKDGMLVVRTTDGMPLPKVGQIKQLVRADNNLRLQLYEEVTRALKLDPTQVGKVKSIFARIWRDKANGGWWIQQDNGGWSRK